MPLLLIQQQLQPRQLLQQLALEVAHLATKIARGAMKGRKWSTTEKKVS
jgi:hypothetical protein